MRRKIYSTFTLTLIVVLLCFLATVEAVATENDKVAGQLNDSIVLYVGSTKALVNNKSVMVDPNNLGVYPVTKNGRTLIPVRFVAENLGATVEWDSKTSTVTMTLNSNKIKLVMGKREMVVNNVSSALDVPAEVIKGRTVVPLRALVEAFGKKVAYYEGFIVISDQEVSLDPVTDKVLIDELITRFNQYGNRMGNLSNSGWIAEKDGWVYTASYEGIYKSKPDGSEKTKICNDKAWDLNIVGDWIFYVNSSDIDNIYRIRTDGKQRDQVNRDPVRSTMVVRGDWIYYIKKDDPKFESYLYKMKLDGSSKTRLTDDYDSVLMYLDGDWIYYVENSVLKRVSVNGGASQQVISDDIFFYNITGEWIYYENLSDEGKLYKIKIDGSGKTKISENVCQEILVFGEWVYYANGFDELKAYTVKTDGTEEHRLSDQSAFAFNIVGEEVVYRVLE